MILLSLAIAEIDGINTRVGVLQREISEVTKSTQGTRDPLYASVHSSDYNKFSSIVHNQVNNDDLIKKLAKSKKKFDVMSAIGITEGNLYSYLLDPELTAQGCAMSQDDFDMMQKQSKNLQNLYKTLVFFANQLYAQSNSVGTVVNVDSSITDSEGKQMNISSNIPIEEDNDVSDQTIRTRYKVYLDFLYEATCAVKGVKNEQVVTANALPLLVLLWMEDSFRSYKEDSGIPIMDKRNSKDTPNKMIFPITYTNSEGKLVSKLPKTDIKLPTDTSVSYANISKYLKYACLRAYTKHKANMVECVDKIDSDCFVFARYLFRMFTSLGINLVDKNRKEPYSCSEIADLILNKNNPESLASLIPEYKFSPAFYNKTKSLEDWFNRTSSDMNEDYSISKYTSFKEKIAAPVFNVLNSAGTGHFPLTTQSKTGVVLDEKTETQHILQLMHLNKLLGTGISPSDLYTKLLESKKDRVILFEPMLTYSGSHPTGDHNITKNVQDELNQSANDIFFKVRGLDISIFDEIKTILNADSILPDTSDEVKAFIDNLIDEKIDKIADFYMNMYYKYNWYFPFMNKKENIVDMIRNTKCGGFSSNFIFLLGDCLTLDVYKEDINGVIKGKVECALTKDYKFVTNNTIHIPYLFEDTIKVSKQEAEYNYNINELGKPDKQGRYSVKVTRLAIKNPVC